MRSGEAAVRHEVWPVPSSVLCVQRPSNRDAERYIDGPGVRRVAGNEGQTSPLASQCQAIPIPPTHTHPPMGS